MIQQNTSVGLFILQGLPGIGHALADILEHYPAVRMMDLNSEVENLIEPSYSPADRARAKNELGFDMPIPENKTAEIDGVSGRVMSVPLNEKARTPAVFPDNNQWYCFFKWLWQRGFGDNVINEKYARILTEKRPDIKTCHDPFRDVPLYKRNCGLDIIGTWYYNVPDSRETLLTIETLREAARPEKQEIGLGTTLILYSDTLCPAKQKIAGVMPGDFIQEAIWIGLSRKTDYILIHNMEEITSRSTSEFQQPQLYGQIAELSKNIIQPFWPLLRQMDYPKKPCAFLLSFGSQLFGNTTWSEYGYASGNGYFAALNMAHLPSDIIFDESILDGRLNDYQMLFMHNVSHLPQSVYDKIVLFAKSGGIVVCGEPFAKLIPGSIQFDLDMSKRQKCSYYSYKNHNGFTLLRQKALWLATGMNGVLGFAGFRKDAPRLAAGCFTAAAMEADMRKYAPEMRQRFLDKIKPYADCPSELVLLNTLERGPCKYLFVINDKRIAGDYVGQFECALEKGVPQDTAVSISETGCAVYDLLTHKRVNSSEKDGKTSWNVSLPAAGGKIYAIYPKPIVKLTISVPSDLMTGEAAYFTVKVWDADNKVMPGTHPLKVTIINPDGEKSEFSDYFATVDGVKKIPFIPAENDLKGAWKITVEDLASGKQVISIFSFN